MNARVLKPWGWWRTGMLVDPPPALFASLKRGGFIEAIQDDELEVAVAEPRSERAVARPKRTRGGRKK